MPEVVKTIRRLKLQKCDHITGRRLKKIDPNIKGINCKNIVQVILSKTSPQKPECIEISVIIILSIKDKDTIYSIILQW